MVLNEASLRQSSFQIVPRTPLSVARQNKATEAGVSLLPLNLYQQKMASADQGESATIIGWMSAAPGSMLLSPHYRFSNDGGATQLEVYQQFVGSLRKSGYKGNVVLGVIPKESDPDASNILNRYLKYRNVTVYPIKFVPCTSDAAVGLAGHKSKSEACVHPYPDSKLQWSRYHFARDWLDACHHCGDGPVLLIDLRDTLFQRNPFESALTIGGLQLFEEDSSRTTLHWTTDLAFKGCKGMRMNETMLASGAVLGTRIAVNKYFEIINEEMKRWMADSNCRHHWDDQAVQNYLFYTGQIPFARPVKNGHGMVLNVGIKGEAVMQLQPRTPRCCRSFATTPCPE